MGSTGGAFRRPGRVALIALVGSLGLVLTLGASPAAATRAFGYHFGVEGTLGGQFANHDPRALAVNETGAGGVAAGTVYATDPESRRVESFAPGGSFLGLWGRDVVAEGAGEDTGTGPEVCETAAECKAGLVGESAGSFYTFGGRPMGGIAVDQANGHVYLFDAGNFRVQEFDATGHFLRAWGDDVASSGPNDSGADEQQKLTVKATKGAYSLQPVTAAGRGIATAGSNVVTGVEATLGQFHVGDYFSPNTFGLNPVEPPVRIVAVGAGTITISRNAGGSGDHRLEARENTGATGAGDLSNGSTTIANLSRYTGGLRRRSDDQIDLERRDRRPDDDHRLLALLLRTDLADDLSARERNRERGAAERHRHPLWRERERSRRPPGSAARDRLRRHRRHGRPRGLQRRTPIHADLLGRAFGRRQAERRGCRRRGPRVRQRRRSGSLAARRRAGDLRSERRRRLQRGRGSRRGGGVRPRRLLPVWPRRNRRRQLRRRLRRRRRQRKGAEIRLRRTLPGERWLGRRHGERGQRIRGLHQRARLRPRDAGERRGAVRGKAAAGSGAERGRICLKRSGGEADPPEPRPRL